MREIKFRAYVKDKKKVLPVYSLDFSWIESEPVTIASCGDLNCGMCLDPYEKENVEIMQYTGLKDKNGKEIYEGDILKFKHLKDYSSELQVVSMDKWCWGTEEYAFYEMVERKYEFEVIGNIYENPSLLEEYK